MPRIQEDGHMQRAAKMLLAISLFASSNAAAETIVLDAVGRGFYSQAGVPGPFPQPGPSAPYFIGQLDQIEYRAFFQFNVFQLFFDFPDLRVSSAVFVLNGGSYASSDAAETLTLFDFSPSGPGFLTSGTAGVSGFIDLGSGTAYGSAVMGPDDSGSLAIALNQAAIADMLMFRPRSAIIGAALTSIDGAHDQLLFSTRTLSGALGGQLVIQTDEGVVPEPSSLLLTATGMTALVLLFRQRRRYRVLLGQAC
jgi:hypothetical protein